jgi:DNA-binding transcriptional MerR regulator
MLTIGKLATKAGLSRDTIRFYEREALLPKAARTPAGYRLYSSEMVQRLRFIKQAQVLGFSLTEIRHLLDGYQDAEQCAYVQHLLEHKIAELDQKMHDIQALHEILSRYLAACRQALGHGRTAESCPLLLDVLQEARRASPP